MHIILSIYIIRLYKWETESENCTAMPLSSERGRFMQQKTATKPSSLPEINSYLRIQISRRQSKSAHL